MPNYLFYYEKGTKTDNNARDQIRDFYFGKGERIDAYEKYQNYANLFTDWLFASGAEEAIKLHAAHSPVYPYYYT